MKDFQPRIESLEPMTVASVKAFSQSPETEAWQKMEAWAGPIGLLDDTESHPVFGFNNPAPSPDSSEYGYEFWVAIDSESEAGPEIETKQFDGGLYAVAECNLSEEVNSEFFRTEGYLESWKKLYDWVETSEFKHSSRHGLEKPHDPRASEAELVLDLYLPIDE